GTDARNGIRAQSMHGVTAYYTFPGRQQRDAGSYGKPVDDLERRLPLVEHCGQQLHHPAHTVLVAIESKQTHRELKVPQSSRTGGEACLRIGPHTFSDLPFALSQNVG